MKCPIPVRASEAGPVAGAGARAGVGLLPPFSRVSPSTTVGAAVVGVVPWGAGATVVVVVVGAAVVVVVVDDDGSLISVGSWSVVVVVGSSDGPSWSPVVVTVVEVVVTVVEDVVTVVDVVVVVTSSTGQDPGPEVTVTVSPVWPSPEWDWTRRPVLEMACGWPNVTVSVPVAAVTANFTPGPKPLCPPETSPLAKVTAEGEALTTSARMSAEQNPTATLDRPRPPSWWKV